MFLAAILYCLVRVRAVSVSCCYTVLLGQSKGCQCFLLLYCLVRVRVFSVLAVILLGQSKGCQCFLLLCL